jgi:hypothetical protein
MYSFKKDNFVLGQCGFENIVIISMLAYLIGSIFLGEYIPASDGLGYDGVLYARIARDFFSFFSPDILSTYNVQRIFPSSVVYILLKLFNLTGTNAEVRILFGLLNVVMLVIGIACWKAIAKKFNWTPRVRIISFVGLFINYANLKMSFYYPVLTDTSAFTLGVLMLYGYLFKKKYVLVGTCFIGAFTFPTLLFMGLIQIIFPYKQNKAFNQNRSEVLTETLAFIQAALLSFVCLAAVYSYPYVGLGRAVGGNYSWYVLSISFIALFVFLYAALRPLTAYYWNGLSNLKNSSNIVTLILLVISVKLSLFFLSANVEAPLDIKSFILHIAGQALAYPFNFMVSHIIYFGPSVCLLIFFWKEIVEYLRQCDGLYYLTILYAVLAIGSESRQLINYFPIAIFLVTERLNQRYLNKKFVVAYVVLSIAISKIWLPLNHGDWPSIGANSPDITLQFPLQWYFMSMGPWVSQAMYMINLLQASVAFIAMYVLVNLASKSVNVTIKQ